VRQAGGHISLSSQPGKGTTVKVYLPLAQAAASPSQKPDEAARVRRGDEQILLVEDDPFLRKLTARLLERAGYRIVVAENGRQALDLMAGRGSVDLVVTDVVMPKLGGRDLVDQLKRENKMRAALYLSGYTANSIGNDGVLEEGVHFLGKPFTVDQLLRAVRRALGEE
jgi:CheY-like chemotaxis protein